MLRASRATGRPAAPSIAGPRRTKPQPRRARCHSAYQGNVDGAAIVRISAARATPALRGPRRRPCARAPASAAGSTDRRGRAPGLAPVARATHDAFTMMRAIWALAVVCLLAATGAQPVRAAAEVRPIAQLTDRHPALPAVAAARNAGLVIVARPDSAPPALPLAIFATPPALALRARHAIVVAPHRAHAPGSAAVPTRSARGPPVG
jgi:hypothetical protein